MSVINVRTDTVQIQSRVRASRVLLVQPGWLDFAPSVYQDLSRHQTQHNADPAVLENTKRLVWLLVAAAAMAKRLVLVAPYAICVVLGTQVWLDSVVSVLVAVTQSARAQIVQRHTI